MSSVYKHQRLWLKQLEPTGCRAPGCGEKRFLCIKRTSQKILSQTGCQGNICSLVAWFKCGKILVSCTRCHNRKLKRESNALRLFGNEEVSVRQLWMVRRLTSRNLSLNVFRLVSHKKSWDNACGSCLGQEYVLDALRSCRSHAKHTGATRFDDGGLLASNSLKGIA